MNDHLNRARSVWGEAHCVSPRNARPPGGKRTAAPAGHQDGGTSDYEASELHAADYQGCPKAQASSLPALSRKQVCERLDRDPRTLRRWVASRQFPQADVVLAGKPAWSIESVEAWERREALTRDQIGERFNVTRQALHKWIASGFFPPPDAKAKGYDAWSAKAVEAWLAERDEDARIEYELAEFERALDARWREWERQRCIRAAADMREMTERLRLGYNTDALTEGEVYALCEWAD